MAADVDVANLALISLGADTINALDQNSENARKVNGVYNLLRDEVQRSYPWSFTIKRFFLPTLSTAPLYEYDYAYQLPSDCLRLIDCYDKDGKCLDPDKWVKEGSTVMTNDTNVYAKYISRITDPAQWDSAFVTAFAARLAAELCFPITNSASNSKIMLDVYVSKIKAAKGFDSQEAGTPNIVGGDSYVASRL